MNLESDVLKAIISTAPLNPEQAAEYLGMSVQHLYNLRYQGIGPQCYQPNGKKIYYYKQDLDDWIKRKRDVIKVDE